MPTGFLRSPWLLCPSCPWLWLPSLLYSLSLKRYSPLQSNSSLDFCYTFWNPTPSSTLWRSTWSATTTTWVGAHEAPTRLKAHPLANHTAALISGYWWFGFLWMAPWCTSSSSSPTSSTSSTSSFSSWWSRQVSGVLSAWCSSGSGSQEETIKFLGLIRRENGKWFLWTNTESIYWKHSEKSSQLFGTPQMKHRVDQARCLTHWNAPLTLSRSLQQQKVSYQRGTLHGSLKEWQVRTRKSQLIGMEYAHWGSCPRLGIMKLLWNLEIGRVISGRVKQKKRKQDHWFSLRSLLTNIHSLTMEISTVLLIMEKVKRACSFKSSSSVETTQVLPKLKISGISSIWKRQWNALQFQLRPQAVWTLQNWIELIQRSWKGDQVLYKDQEN